MNTLIAIPFFSNAEWLKRALKSVSIQTVLPNEIAIFDDSIDPAERINLQKVIQDFQEAIPRCSLKYFINSKNLGLAKNWNQILDYAQNQKFEALQILHSDDELKPNYLEAVTRALRSEPHVDAVFVKTEVINAQSLVIRSLPDQVKEWIRPKENKIYLQGHPGIKTVMRGNFIFCPSVLYRISSIGSRRFNEQYKMVMDLEWIIESLKMNQCWLGLYDQIYFRYRRHQVNQTQILNQNGVRFFEENQFYLKVANETQMLSISKMWMVRLNLMQQLMRSLIHLRFKKARQEFNWFLKLGHSVTLSEWNK